MTKENTFEAILCSGCNQIFWFSSNGITMKKFTENDWEGILNLIRLQALQEENIVK